MNIFEFKYNIIIKMIKKLINKKGTYVSIEDIKDIIDLFEEVETENVELMEEE